MVSSCSFQYAHSLLPEIPDEKIFNASSFISLNGAHFKNIRKLNIFDAVGV